MWKETNKIQINASLLPKYSIIFSSIVWFSIHKNSITPESHLEIRFAYLTKKSWTGMKIAKKSYQIVKLPVANNF